jgi:hypothetical protein
VFDPLPLHNAFCRNEAAKKGSLSPVADAAGVV